MDIKITAYDKAYAKDFYDLNIEWLKTFFYVEPFDEEVLSKPNKYIIDKGGFIFFAKKNNTVVGTVALMPTEDHRILENAIYLYRKYSFKELELEKNNPYERADIKMLLEF
jgi:hypothetical protein